MMRPDMYSSSFIMNTTSLAEAAAAVQNRSPWHSPVPYLFGGLAAMLGLIAFALLILACSYWKLSGYFESNAEAASAAAGNHDQQQSTHEGGRRTDDDVMMMMKPLESLKICGDYEEKIVVIMAGEQKPTFLAKPVKSSSSFKTADLEAADHHDDQLVKKEGFDDQMGDDNDDQTKKDYNLEEEREHEHGNHHHAVADLDHDEFVGRGGAEEYNYSADRHE